MRIEYRTIEPAEKGRFWSRQHEVVKVELCCNAMKVARQRRRVTLAGTAAMMPEFCLLFNEPDHEGGVGTDYERISFCPWCGRPIELVQVEKVLRTERQETTTVQRQETKTVYDDKPLPLDPPGGPPPEPKLEQAW